MPEIHQARRARAQQLIRELGADAALITAGPNVRYLTGLASSNAALLLPADGDAVVATDFRYAGRRSARPRPQADHGAVHRAALAAEVSRRGSRGRRSRRTR